jgi:hypothetical protein
MSGTRLADRRPRRRRKKTTCRRCAIVSLPERHGITAYIQIYYSSRTHTQLRQLTTELLKTSFPAKIDNAHGKPSTIGGAVADDTDGVSLVPLASRRQLCINSRIQALGRKGGDERMNEACLDMQKGGSAARCEFLPRKDDEAGMLGMRDAVLVSAYGTQYGGPRLIANSRLCGISKT